MKEFFQKRWLYLISLIFIYGVSLYLIIEKMITIKEVTATTAINLGGLILGLAYFGFINKKVRAKIADMKPSPFKTFVNGLNSCIPFAVAGCLLYVANNAFDGADSTAWCICACVLFGTILQTIEAVINKEYLYEKEINELAKQQADIEKKKAELLADKGVTNAEN